MNVRIVKVNRQWKRGPAHVLMGKPIPARTLAKALKAFWAKRNKPARRYGRRPREEVKIQ